MTTKREYAISLGLAKPGRGRMSAAAHDAINKAISEGMTFSDTLKAPAKTEKAPAAKATQDNSVIAPTAAIREPNGYSFFYMEGGKKRKVSNRTACYNCGYSVGWHLCNAPAGITKDGLKDFVYE